jgi:hypothetical protein
MRAKLHHSYTVAEHDIIVDPGLNVTGTTVERSGRSVSPKGRTEFILPKKRKPRKLPFAAYVFQQISKSKQKITVREKVHP